MRTAFSADLPLSPAQIDQLVRTATIVLDANVLLNLYRYSDDTSKRVLEVLDGIKERLWLPHQFALEFHRNRSTVLTERCKLYEGAAKDLDSLIQKFPAEDKIGKHPFLPIEKINQLTSIVKELRQYRDSHLSSFRNDETIAKVADIFDGRIGPPTEETDEAKVHEEAQRRIDNRLPPGFRDRDKEVPRRFGDYIAWRQILDQTAREKTSIVLVTGDVKEDWWEIHHGLHLGPRVELRREFHKVRTEPRSDFWIIEPRQFIESAGSELEINVSAAVLNEIVQTAEQTSLDVKLLKSTMPIGDKVEASLPELETGDFEPEPKLIKSRIGDEES